MSYHVRSTENEIEISKDFNSIKFQKVETYDDDMDVITLTENEIERIHNLDLQKEALINARKWLILSIFTGQRGTTLVERINQKNFHPFGNEYKIELKQIKGNKKVYIPVLPPVKKYLRRVCHIKFQLKNSINISKPFANLPKLMKW